MIDASTGTSYGVQVRENGGDVWTTRHGWFSKEGRMHGALDGFDRARECAEHERDEVGSAPVGVRIVRRDVTVQVVAG